MLRFILRRILIIIPELFIISVICFFLMQSLTSRFYLSEPENIHSLVRSKTDANAFIPKFYFSLVPSSYPDTIFKIPESPQKERIKKFLHHGYKWEEIQDYLVAEQQVINEISFFQPDFKSTIEQFENTSELRTTDLMITDSIRKSAEYGNWKSLLDKLDATQAKWKVFIPAFRYHGLENKYHVWIKNFLSGKSGNSTIDNKPVWAKIGEAINWTLTLSLISLFLIFFLGYFIGEKLFLIKSKAIARIIDAILFLFDSLPSFFLGMTLIYLFATSTVSSALQIFPTPGFVDFQSDDTLLKTLSKYASSLVLPIVCIVLPSLAYLSRLVYQKINSEFKKPYSFAAWSEGKSNREITQTEIRKNSLLPLISLLGMEIPALISGTVLIEILFNIPGMGRLTYQSIVLQDWPIVFHVLILTALFTILGKLVSDTLIFSFDQRIKAETK